MTRFRDRADEIVRAVIAETGTEEQRAALAAEDDAAALAAEVKGRPAPASSAPAAVDRVDRIVRDALTPPETDPVAAAIEAARGA